jgi:hypothetical protein
MSVYVYTIFLKKTTMPSALVEYGTSFGPCTTAAASVLALLLIRYEDEPGKTSFHLPQSFGSWLKATHTTQTFISA